MIKNKGLLLVVSLSVFLISCSNKYYYSKGLSRAQHPTTNSIYNGLTQVVPANNKLKWDTINGQPYVLAVTWKADTIYYTQKSKYNTTTGLYSYNTGNYPVFVTVAPYLKERDFGHLKDKKLTMRLNQLLGLPPVARYSYFLEIWVKPEDMIRPCFDPAISTNVCEFAPSKGDKQNETYMNWLYQYIYDSYQDPDQMKQYPFSHLGYTYDWNPRNRSHVGLSEFVIGKNKDIYVKKVYTTRGYFE
ncbi:MAG: hypothetical protein JWQ38_2245 [Flavipsychrobacter sp.]|nr:hypothetical protein [Flavipsychrobacter sp.]